MFDFDPAKSAANKSKHGIDFDEAQKLWLDPDLLDLAEVTYGGEDRKLVVGTLGERRWTAVVTRRGEGLRIISVRRARQSEEMAYDRGRI